MFKIETFSLLLNETIDQKKKKQQKIIIYNYEHMH